MTDDGGGPSDPAGRWPKHRYGPLARRVVALAARLVPGEVRARRRAEWDAELWQVLSGRAGAISVGGFLAGVLGDVVSTWASRVSPSAMLRDVRHSFRTLRRAPRFAGTAIVTLALAIGGGTALFSVVDQAVFSDPPWPDVERIVAVDMLFGDDPAAMNVSVWSYPRFSALRDATSSIPELGGYADRTMTMTGIGDPEIMPVEVVTPSLLPLLGAEARLGRLFGPDEADRGAPTLVALVSETFWDERLGRDPNVVGRRLTLDQIDFRIVGVVGAPHEGVGGGIAVWVPMSALRVIEDDGALDDPWNQHFRVLGRLAPGADLERARSEVRTFGESVVRRFPPPPGAENVISSADVVTIREARAQPGAMASMWALAGAVALLLFIATANLASLCLARGAARRTEAAIRASLGAAPSRLVWQMLTESLALAALGGALGVVLAAAGMRLLGAWLTSALYLRGARGLELIDPSALSMDGRVLAFAFLVTAGAGLLFGVLPGLQAARTNPATWLRGGRASLGGGRRSAPLARQFLVTGQVAVTLVLLAGSAVMLRTMAGLQRVDLGFEAEGLLTAMYTLSPADLEAGREPATFHTEVVDALRALPGVEFASAGEVPMGGPVTRTLVMGSEGRPELTPSMHVRIRIQGVSDGHLTLLGADFVEGRDIDRSDDADADPVVVLSRTAAEELFPDGGALGRRLQLGWVEYQQAGATVVGVVDDLRLDRPDLGGELQAFVSLRQAARPETGLLIRARGDPGTIEPSVRRLLAERAPEVVLTSVMPIESRVLGVTTRPRVLAALLTVFGALGLLLISVGLYGTIAYSVARRTRELGLRASLGASPASLIGLLMRPALGFVLLGIGLGVLAATRATAVLEGLAFDTRVVDPTSLAAVSGLLLLVAAAAAVVPARRGTRVQPTTALRGE